LVDAPDANTEAAAAEEAMDSSMHLSFDDKSTTVVTATPSAVDESPTTGATSPADQDQTQTAEAKRADSDIAMADEELPLTIDEKVLGALEHQSRAGTDQQDVEEVIGNIINRLQAAIQPSSINEQTGIQMELIMETFFVKMVNYTKKFGEPAYQTEVGFDRSITAYPAAKGSCTLYDALARNFDQQVLAESKLWRYTAIQKLPPVLHVLIQRSSVGHKNENPVIIPETLYLDRYMDTDHRSPEFKLRNAQWAVANRLDDLKEIKEALGPPEPKRIKLDCDADEVELREIASFDPSFDVEGPLSVDLLGGAQSSDESAKEAEATEATTAEPASAEPAATQPSSSESSSEPMATEPASTKPAPTEGQAAHESNPELETKIWDMMLEELEKRGEQLRVELEGPKNHPYRLQAVICHTGRLTSGHYWVWIHDFEKHVWRKYNDEYVEENPETDAVLKQLNQSGHPYYLCYVRNEDKNDFVNVPERSIPEPPTYESLPKVDETSRVDSDGDCAIIDSDEDVKVAMAKHREVVEVMDAPAPEDVPDLV
jgi:ubiquitin carboxyl-terminal hydrolase 25